MGLLFRGDHPVPEGKVKISSAFVDDVDSEWIGNEIEDG